MEENISFTNGVFFSLQEVKDLDENISHISVGGKINSINIIFIGWVKINLSYFFVFIYRSEIYNNLKHINYSNVIKYFLGKCIAIAFERIVRVYDHNSTFIREFKFDNLNEIEAIHLVSDGK